MVDCAFGFRRVYLRTERPDLDLPIRAFPAKGRWIDHLPFIFGYAGGLDRSKTPGICRKRENYINPTAFTTGWK